MEGSPLAPLISKSSCGTTNAERRGVMRVKRFIFTLVLVALAVVQQPHIRDAQKHAIAFKFRPAYSNYSIGLMSNCPKLLYLPKAPRPSILHRLLD